MIKLLYGENTFLVQRDMKRLYDTYGTSSAREVYEGTDIAPEQLPTILQGVSLFSSHKQVIIKGASENKAVWSELAHHIESFDTDSELILVEATPDKRTKTYKLLQKVADIVEHAKFSEGQARAWVTQEAAHEAVPLSSQQVARLVSRVGVDAWQLHFAIEKLRVFDHVTDELIDEIIHSSPHASVFSLLDAVFAKQSQAAHTQLAIIKATQDPYQFFGLLAQQFFMLLTLSASSGDAKLVAKDLGVHPYPLQKMTPQAQALSASERKNIVDILRRCDDGIKRSGREPWLVIEQAIMKLLAI